MRISWQEKYNMGMKKVFSFLFLCVFAAACAGNPPAWWNPGNRYGTADGSVTISPTPRSTTRTPVPVKEEEIDVVDQSYEEITLTPMPDEDEENDTGVAASQNEELTPHDDSLPLPSVLE